MSFLARVNTVHATASALSVTAVRSMSLTARLNRGPVGAARDTLRKADRTVAGAAVKGIEKGGMSKRQYFFWIIIVFSPEIRNFPFPNFGRLISFVMCRKSPRQTQGCRPDHE